MTHDGAHALAVTLRLDPTGAAPLEAMWRMLAERDIDHDRHRLGYGPHVTLAIYPDETPAAPVATALERLAPTWDALPVSLAGLGIFPGATSILWAVPVITPELLDRQKALQSALPDLPVHPHYLEARLHHGQTGPPSNPAVSGRPQIRFAFCTA